MAEFRGTSGDWHLAAQNDVLHVIAGAAPSQGNDEPWHERTDRVVLARLYDRADGEGHPSHEEAAANGLVMAAAPDLLAACKAVLYGNVPEGEAVRLVEAAVAKAEAPC